MGIRDDYGWWLPRSTPRPAKGGIKARSRRGRFGQTWWGRRWIEVLESFPIGARLSRGQSYARQGQVLSIDVAKGQVVASVQGSARRPYAVRIELKPLTRREWRKVGERLADDLKMVAALLAGELPDGMEEVFRACGASLFPARERDLTTDCNCPDLSNPCKHIAAVYYLLAEEFDRDPFLLIVLRGLDRDELTAMLGGPGAQVDPEEKARAGKTDAGSTIAAGVAGPGLHSDDVAQQSDPALDPDSFWGSSAVPTPDPASVIGVSGLDAAAGEADAHEAGAQGEVVDAALARGLGPFPFWQGSTPLVDALAPMYQKSEDLARDLLAGES